MKTTVETIVTELDDILKVSEDLEYAGTPAADAAIRLLENYRKLLFKLTVDI